MLAETSLTLTPEVAAWYVDNGVKALDEHGPYDWRYRIIVDELDILNPWRCVLGQVFGSYLDGLDMMPEMNTYEHGFDCAIRSVDHDILVSAWRERLALAS